MTENLLESDYLQFTEQAGFAILPGRSTLKILGTDRKKLLHSFCTADIESMTDGQVCEAFVLNEKGKILGYIHVINAPDFLLLTGHGDQSQTLTTHLDRYVIREDVRFEILGTSYSTLFVAGPGAILGLSKVFDNIPDRNSCLEVSFPDSVATPGELVNRVWLAQMELAGWGLAIFCPTELESNLCAVLKDHGIAQCCLESLDLVRIESGTPWFSIDADDSNLPQELQRDEQAICFEKGCYLGQETVARIDSLGRVNQLFVKLKILDDSEKPRILEVEGKQVGKITSLGASRPQRPRVGLGFVKRKFKDPGTIVDGVEVQS